jgi:hypothetical protein
MDNSRFPGLPIHLRDKALYFMTWNDSIRTVTEKSIFRAILNVCLYLLAVGLEINLLLHNDWRAGETLTFRMSL